MHARLPSTAVAALIGAALLVGSAAAGVAVVHHHSSEPAPKAVVTTNPTNLHVFRTTTVASVAPLTHLVEPDLMVTTPKPLAQTVISKLRHVERARHAVSVDTGTVRINGRPAHAMAADLSNFRGFMPPPTAASDQLWQNLANGDIAISYEFAKAARLAAGQQVLLGTKHVRVGAVASFGLPKVGVIMSRQVGATLRLRPHAGVLLSAPGHSADTLTARARDVMGHTASIVPMTKDNGSNYTGKPRTYIELYQAAARTCRGLSWTILAAIGQVESGHGRNVGPSSAGALGPMQFLPSTWASWGVDADGDKKADIMDPYDAVYSAAGYLCYYNPGASLANLKRAIFAYNHADWYVNEVLALAKLYR